MSKNTLLRFAVVLVLLSSGLNLLPMAQFPTWPASATALEETPEATTPNGNGNVLTRSYTNDRLGANNQETRLTTSNVMSTTFGKLFTRKVDDPIRNPLERQAAFECPTVVPTTTTTYDQTHVTPLTTATCNDITHNPGQIYSQPLYLANLTIPGKGTHNVVFVATERNNLYAFDADDPNQPDPLWYRQLGPYGVSPLNEFGTRYQGAYTDIYPYVGIVGTPVIDLTTFTMYIIVFNRDVEGNKVAFHHRLYALDIRTGQTKDLGAGNSNPKIIAGFVPGTGADGLPQNDNFTDGDPNKVTFESRQHLQRAALLLVDGTVYVSFTGYAGTNPYHGWLMAYDAPTLGQLAIFITTPNSGSATPDNDVGQGGIWMSAQGPVADEQGNILVVSANGTADTNNLPANNLADSTIKLKLTRSPSPTLTVKSFYTPSDREFLRQADQDLGVAGVILLPYPAVTGPLGQPLSINGSKEGRLFVLNRGNGPSDDLGGYVASGPENYIERIQVTPPRGTNPLIGRHIHGTPGFWQVPPGLASAGPNIYVMGEADFLKQYRQDPASKLFGPNPFYTSTVSAPEKGPYDDPRRNGPQSIPGGTIAVTSNNGQANTGIVWVYHQLCGDANIIPKPGILRAFDATDVRHELWNSEQVVLNPAVPNICPTDSTPPPTPGYNSRDGNWYFSKFSQAIVVNGKAYAPTFSGELVVFGLFSTIVTKPVDDGSVGSLSYALKNSVSPDTIYFDRQTITSTLKITGSLTGTLTLGPGVNLQGSTCDQPLLIIDGTNAPPGTIGLNVQGGSQISGLHFANFGGLQVKVDSGSNKFSCFKASKHLSLP